MNEEPPGGDGGRGGRGCGTCRVGGGRSGVGGDLEGSNQKIILVSEFKKNSHAILLLVSQTFTNPKPAFCIS